jgi:predicted lysophospholipase L1 biosynthesis ABC-type transport system permease subunit
MFYVSNIYIFILLLKNVYLWVKSMQSESVTFSGLLTIAVSILSLGVNLIHQGQYATGVACLAIGFGIILIATILIEKGIIKNLKRKQS